MNPFSDKRASSSVASGLIAITLAAAAVVLPHWNGLFPLRFSELAAIHMTLSSAIFAAAFAVLWQFCAALFDVYSYPNESWLVSVPRIAACAGTMTALLALYIWPTQSKPQLAKVLAAFLFCAIVCELLRLVIISHLQRPKNRAIIIGSGRLATKAWREFRTQPGSDVTLVGFVDQASEADMCPDIAARYLGGLEELSRIIVENNIDDVIVATPLAGNFPDAEHAIYIAGAMGSRIVCLKDVCGVRHEALARDDDDAFFELVPAARLQGLRQAAKRGFDVGVSAAILAFGSLMLLVAVMFAAVRRRRMICEPEMKLGFRRKSFRTFRIRSVPGGRLFQLCVTTLPLVWNVLRGEMSLVGPPPLSVEETYRADINSLIGRFNVRPGITECTDFEPIQMRGTHTSDFKVACADSWSLRTDLKILTKTFRMVVQRTNAVETGIGAS
ncbi:MAG TPA: sugar transferase [Terracidiphilus sp.]|jgi:lipopolysaccharide/colanic/teichoic acid biosynthesis glycosyltransferase